MSQSPNFSFGVYIVHSTHFIFCLNAFLVSTCSKDLLTAYYLLCWPQGTGTGLLCICTQRLAFHNLTTIFRFNFVLHLFFQPILFTLPRPQNGWRGGGGGGVILNLNPLHWFILLRGENDPKQLDEIQPGGRGGGGVLGLIIAGYVPLAFQSPYAIMVYSVANYRPHLRHFWANM